MSNTLPGQRALLVIAALAAASGVALAALASHAFADVLVGKAATRFDSALKIHLLHAPLLFALALAALYARRLAWWIGSVAVVTGMLVFCGGLYLASLAGNATLVPIVPMGGSAIILGWVVLAIGFALGGQGSGHHCEAPRMRAKPDHPAE